MKNKFKKQLKELLKAQRMAREGILFAPESFINASVEELREVCNGCGAADSWFRPPPRIYGTLIVYACIIHDWMYEFGKCNEDKKEADRSFRNNMQRLILRDKHKWWKPTILQLSRVNTYYQTVVKLGGTAFWKGKN